MKRIAVMAMALLVAAPAARTAASTPGPRAGDAGRASVHSDFNGDGYADLAVGVSAEDVGDIVDGGAVNVLYGSPAGVQATAPDDQSWTQDSTGVQDQVETGDEFGAALAAADFNSDGFADLAIGVRTEDFGIVTNAGAVNVIYGSSCGLQADPTCGNPDDQFWTQDSPGVKDQGDDYDQFGIPMTSGDFNGDGYADLAVSVPNESLPNAMGAGAVNVIFGSAVGLQATSPDDQFWTQNSASVKDKAELDGFSAATGVGDFNGDGFDDLAVGVPLENLGGAANTGAVNVLYGSATGLQATGAGGPDDQFWHQSSPGLNGDGNETDDHFGISVVSADFNTDGFDDLAVGARYEDLGTLADAGAMIVLYGSAAGLQDTAPDDQVWTQDSPDIAGDGAEAGDQFGKSLVAVDFNDDGYADLAISASRDAVGTVAGAGAVDILYGSATGLQATGVGGLDDQFWTQDSPDVQDHAEDNDQLGDRMGSGDFNGDGFVDLAIGVRFEDIPGAQNAGALGVLYGSADGVQAVSPDDQLWTQNSPDIAGDGAQPSDRFSSWVEGGG
jgi:FG-GAP repeat protein